jgi:hypothetical protein
VPDFGGDACQAPGNLSGQLRRVRSVDSDRQLRKPRSEFCTEFYDDRVIINGGVRCSEQTLDIHVALALATEASVGNGNEFHHQGGEHLTGRVRWLLRWVCVDSSPYKISHTPGEDRCVSGITRRCRCDR